MKIYILIYFFKLVNKIKSDMKFAYIILILEAINFQVLPKLMVAINRKIWGQM